MRIAIPTKSYNLRRDGKPWICRVTAWDVGKRLPDVEWGSWIGSPGEAGELVISAEPYDVLRTGQNDLRGSNHNSRRYRLVCPDGSIIDLRDSVAAWLCQSSERVHDAEELIAELKRERYLDALAELTFCATVLEHGEIALSSSSSVSIKIDDISRRNFEIRLAEALKIIGVPEQPDRERIER